MATGIEVVGLVLGSLPLIIKGLSFYLEGVKKIKQFLKYQIILESLETRLKTQWTIFSNSCENLLQDIVDDSELLLLLNDPRSKAWKVEDLQIQMRIRLGSNGAISFMDTMVDMAHAVNQLRSQLELDENYQVQWADAKVFKKQWKRLLMVLQEKQHEELLKRMSDNNYTFITLLGQGAALKPLRTAKRTAHAKMYNCVRDHARTLYVMLKESFTQSCGCTIPHKANLRLEARTNVSRAQDCCEDPFVFLFHFENSLANFAIVPPWNWREIIIKIAREEPQEQSLFSKKPDKTSTTVTSTTVNLPPPNLIKQSIKDLKKQIRGVRKITFADAKDMAIIQPSVSQNKQSVSTSSAPPTAEEHSPTLINQSTSAFSQREIIKDLCTALHDVPEDKTKLGVLVDLQDRRHEITKSDGKFFPASPTGITSLATILKQSSLDLRDRLSLGTKLASATLQLCGTPWIREQWSKSDIYFAGTSNSFIANPFVSKTFIPPTCILGKQGSHIITGSPATLLPLIRNPATFSLGVILIELWYGKPMEDLQIAADLNGANIPTAFTEFVTVRRKAEELYREAPEPYAAAVRRCIFCEFDQNHSSLDNESFKEAVHQGVVIPLEQNLKFYIGGIDDLLPQI